MRLGGGATSDAIESFKPYGWPEAPSHKMYFLNDYGQDGTVRFLQNFRNPAMAAFHANDVVREQREWIKANVRASSLPEVTKLVRSNVVSSSGGNWMRRLGSSFAEGDLDSTQLATFLATTVNGKSSQRIAADLGKTIVSGNVSGSAANWTVTLMLGSNAATTTAVHSASAATNESPYPPGSAANRAEKRATELKKQFQEAGKNLPHGFDTLELLVRNIHDTEQATSQDLQADLDAFDVRIRSLSRWLTL
jgi:hypothetical protein